MAQQIDKNQGQVTQHGDIHIHSISPVRVSPVDHPNGRNCPQCHTETWRMNQWCIHCGADLFAIDQQARDRRIAVRKIQVGGTLLVFAALLLWGQCHLPEGPRSWALITGAASIVVASAVLRD